MLVLVQYAGPGRSIYHAGWYNVAIAALAIWMLCITPRAAKRFAQRARAGIWLAASGVTAVAFAGVVNGLLGPDDQVVVGAPGSSIPVAQVGGALVFPLANAGADDVSLARGASAKPVRGERYTARALLRVVDRTVVAIDARDGRGAHLTITQPTGTEFLSTVLLMQAQQTIGGLTLPYDSFALPGAHRIVKAVLFSHEQALKLPALATAPGAVVLFDVQDETGASLPHGIGVAPSGTTATIAGIHLTPRVLHYPSIEIVALPDAVVVTIGILAAIAGLLLTLPPNQGTIPQR
jgi:hypothetical protein